MYYRNVRYSYGVGRTAPTEEASDFGAETERALSNIIYADVKPWLE